MASAPTSPEALRAIVVFLPEIFDSQLIAPGQTEPVWPNALLGNQSSRAPVQRRLGAILGAKKLRPGVVIEHFGVAQTWARLKEAARAVGFDEKQLIALPYDWRREPLGAISDLCGFCPPGDGPVILLGHGYGGLVAKALVQAKPPWLHRVILLAHLGVPHHGSDLERLFALHRPMGWISPLTWKTLCDARAAVPALSVAAMTRPWMFGVKRDCPELKEVDVFSRCYPTPIVRPDRAEDEFLAWHGDGLLLDLCAVRDDIERIESDRFHADLPACPKFWRHLARLVAGRRPQTVHPWASGAIHLQRSHAPAAAYIVGLRFRSGAGLESWVEAQAMTCAGGKFAPHKDPERCNDASLIVGITPIQRRGHYAAFEEDDMRKFVVLRLWALSTWPEPRGAPVLLDERLLFLSPPEAETGYSARNRFRIFLGSAAHWLGQRPIANRRLIANGSPGR